MNAVYMYAWGPDADKAGLINDIKTYIDIKVTADTIVKTWARTSIQVKNKEVSLQDIELLANGDDVLGGVIQDTVNSFQQSWSEQSGLKENVMSKLESLKTTIKNNLNNNEVNCDALKDFLISLI